MSAKRRGLGRGLESMLSPVAATPAESGEGLRELPVDLIHRGRYQPRRQFDDDELERLAASIRQQGVVQPIVVRPRAEGGYELVAGERRWRAAQRAGLETLPAVVREVEDQSALAIALIENIQRQNLNPMDEAVALQRLTEEFGLTHQAVAEAVGRSRVAVSNLLRLLQLGAPARALVEEGRLEMGHARALLGVSGALQDELAERVAAEGLSVRQTEKLVAAAQQDPAPPPIPRRPDPNIQQLERRLGERLGAPVRLEHGNRGNGRLVIRYASLAELDGILQRIGDPESN